LIYFGGETTVKEDANGCGALPFMSVEASGLSIPTRSIRFSMTSAMSRRAKMASRIFEETTNGDRVIECLAGLNDGAPRDRPGDR
jgi:hypothetical protein